MKEFLIDTLRFLIGLSLIGVLIYYWIKIFIYVMSPI